MQNALVLLSTTLACFSKNTSPVTLIVKEIEFFHYQNGSRRNKNQKKQEPESIVDIDQEDDLSEWYELFNIAVEGV